MELQTKRLILRAWKESDAEAYTNMHGIRTLVLLLVGHRIQV